MEKVSTTEEIFSRAVGSFIDPEGAFRKKLTTNPEKIIIKFGVDPTRPDIHLGHAVVFRKLRQLQDLGCKVVFLVGDYTAQIGDPTGKSKVRPEISQQEVEKNMQTFLDQVGRILRTDEAVFTWIRNSDWFVDITDIEPAPGTQVRLNGLKDATIVPGNSFVGKALIFEETRMQKTHLKRDQIQTVSFSRILGTLRRITHARLIERDMFQDRLNSHEELYMHEMLYPVMQGIDSQVIASIYGSCDLEVGGTDQTFNMLIGRDVMKINNQDQQAVLSFKLLEGLDGKEKMSKSLDNYIAITDTPANMYGKVMSIPDASIANYFELCTYTPVARVAEIKQEIASGKVNPRDLKMDLARQIVAGYHGEAAATAAEADFVGKFQKKEIPEVMDEVMAQTGTPIVTILLEKGLVSSKSDFRRLVESGAVTDLDQGVKLTDPQVVLEQSIALKIGKHTFIRIKIS